MQFSKRTLLLLFIVIAAWLAIMPFYLDTNWSPVTIQSPIIIKNQLGEAISGAQGKKPIPVWDMEIPIIPLEDESPIDMDDPPPPAPPRDVPLDVLLNPDVVIQQPLADEAPQIDMNDPQKVDDDKPKRVLPATTRPHTCDRGSIDVVNIGGWKVYDFFPMNNEQYVAFVSSDRTTNARCIFPSGERPADLMSTGYLWAGLTRCPIPDQDQKTLREQTYLDFTVRAGGIQQDVRICTYPDEKPYYVANCLIYRNDDNILRQFLQWNQMMGMQHFYMYDHLSTDTSNELLKPYIDSGLVTYHSWRNYRPEPHTIQTYHVAQDTALLSCLNRYRDKNVWIWVGDSDEFIYPGRAENFTYLLQKYEHNQNIDGYRVHGWRWQDDPEDPLPLIPDPKKQTVLIEPYPLNMTFPEKYQFQSLEIGQSTFKMFVKIGQVVQSGLHDLNGAGNSIDADENDLQFLHFRMERYGRPNDKVKYNPAPYQRFGKRIKCC